jgi:hypothetical protein
MKRLELPESGKMLRLRRWLHPRFSPVALYRGASDYGNSYWKPLIWMLTLLTIFSMLLPFPTVGLKRQPSGPTETYVTVWNKADNWGPNILRELKIATKAGIAAVDAAGFQRNVEYLPAYPWGRVLAFAIILLTSSLFGLFLLAVRRQFKR